VNVLYRYPRATVACCALQVLVYTLWWKAITSGSLTTFAWWGGAGTAIWLASAAWAAFLQIRCNAEEYREGRGEWRRPQ
jgi:hypothetical protein